MMLLVIGGSGSGKSAWAEKAIQRAGPAHRYYVATMRPFGADADARIARHRAQRASLGFETIEQPAHIGDIRLSSPAAVLVEDLPNLLANEMFGGGGVSRILPDIESLARRSETLVIVSGQVFSDGVCYDGGTQDYIRELARLHQCLAQRADAVVEVVYSIPVALKGEWTWD